MTSSVHLKRRTGALQTASVLEYGSDVPAVCVVAALSTGAVRYVTARFSRTEHEVDSSAAAGVGARAQRDGRRESASLDLGRNVPVRPGAKIVFRLNDL